MLAKILSRKFILTVLVILLVFITPLLYNSKGVSETLTLTVLGLFGAVGAAYGFMNVKAKALGEDDENKSK